VEIVADETASPLKTQNVTVNGRRTSVRLERAMQDALHEACKREGLTIHGFCEAAKERYSSLRLTAAIRAALIDYYRTALRDAENGR
jgi:predicted DNA-binding ribbon-helix-helix protein